MLTHGTGIESQNPRAGAPAHGLEVGGFPNTFESALTRATHPPARALNLTIVPPQATLPAPTLPAKT